MNLAISRFYLFSLCGLAAFCPAVQTELSALELCAGEEAGVSWEAEFKWPDASARTGKPPRAWQVFVQNDLTYRPFGVLAESSSAGGLGYRMPIQSVPPEPYFPAPSRFRLIPTYWAEVLRPIPTTWDAEIILVQEISKTGYLLESASRCARLYPGAGGIDLTER